MSIKSVYFGTVKGAVSPEMIEKVEDVVGDTTGLYVANIESKLRDYDPALANEFMEEIEEAKRELNKYKEEVL